MSDAARKIEVPALQYWKLYDTEAEAIAAIQRSGFTWNESRKRWEKLKAGINYQANAGQCKGGKWMVGRA